MRKSTHDMADNAMKFSLKRGKTLLVNHRLIELGRGAFEDVPGAARRCLVGAWVEGFVDSYGERLPLRD
jgi:hypothetical protein